MKKNISHKPLPFYKRLPTDVVSVDIKFQPVVIEFVMVPLEIKPVYIVGL